MKPVSIRLAVASPLIIVVGHHIPGLLETVQQQQKKECNSPPIAAEVTQLQQ